MKTTPPPSPHARWLGIAAATACLAIVGIGLSLSIPLTSFIMEARGASGALIGANVAMAALANLAIAPFVPGLARRIGVTALLTVSIFVAAASLIAFFYADAFWAWFVIRFVNGAALGTVFIVSEFWINAVADERRRGLIMGIYATILSLGIATGPIVLALVGFDGLAPFAVGAAIMLAGIVPVLIGGRVAPRIGEPARGGVLAFLLAAPAATVAGFVYGAVESSTLSLLPIYGINIGMSAAEAALLLSVFGLGNVALQIPIGLLSDRTDRRLVLLVCAAVGVAGMALLPLLAGSFVLVSVLIFVWGGVTAGMYTVGLTHLGARFVGASLAQANAAFVMLYSLGMLVGPASVGATFDAMPPHGFALALGTFFATYLVIVTLRMAGRGAVEGRVGNDT